MSSGRVIGWGVNVSGEATGVPVAQLLTNAAGATMCSTGVVLVAGSNVLAVSTSEGFSLALKADHTVFGWGDNQYGQAIGKTTPEALRNSGPVLIDGQLLKNVTCVAAGNGFGVACKEDGTVVTWGRPQRGAAISSVPALEQQRKIETPVIDPVTGNTVGTNVMLIPNSSDSRGRLAVKRTPDGVVSLRADENEATPLTNVVAVAARGFYTIALKGDGTVVSWGIEPWVQIHLPSGLSNVVSIACGGGAAERGMALKKDGTVVVWKSGSPHLEDVPREATNVVEIAAGLAHSLALRRDGTVFGWGVNVDGQATGVPTIAAPDSPGFSSGQVTLNGEVLHDVVAIAAHDRYSLALKKDGTVVGWGRGCPPIPAGLTNVAAISAGPDFCLAVQSSQQR